MALNLAATLLQLSFDTLHTPYPSMDELVVRAHTMPTEHDYSQYRYLLACMVPKYHEVLLETSDISATQLMIDTLQANHESPWLEPLVNSRNAHVAYLDKRMDIASFQAENGLYLQYFNEKSATKRLFTEEAKALTTLEMDSLYDQAKQLDAQWRQISRPS